MARVEISTKEHSTSISVDDAWVASFDLEGRMLSVWDEERTVSRGISGRMLERRRQELGRERRWLDEEECSTLLEETRTQAIAVARQHGLRTERCEDIERWTPDRYRADLERFNAIYRPITILPPDQYLSIVLQVAQGCTWNRCRFCEFYQDREFHVLATEQAVEHAEAVRDLFGRSLALRKGVFLGDGNALALPLDRLMPLCEVARRVFPERAIHSFLDVFGGERHGTHEWAALHDAGLESACIGAETGHPALLEQLGKPNTPQQLNDLVVEVRSGGVKVNLVYLIGVGGREMAEAHREATFAQLEHVYLGAGDRVYLSPFIEEGAARYQELAAAQGWTPLTAAELREELQLWSKSLRSILPSDVQVARYDIRDFLY